MGAWGPGSFENDDALDWAAELDGLDVPAVEQALRTACEATPGLESSSIGIAAAAVVAAAIDGRADELPPELRDWTLARRPALAGLRDDARDALRSIRSDSELRDLWAESDDLDAWTSVVDALIARLTNMPA